MRIVTLATEQWGALSLDELRLQSRGRLQLVFGDNEAGKSTTMRAIRALVRGITDDDPAPRRAQDAVVRAQIELHGQTLVVERRGTSRPGAPPRVVGGPPVAWPAVDRRHYDGVVCIDHAALRRGGAAMLRSDGELGSVLLRTLVDGDRLDAEHRKVTDRLKDLFNAQANARNPRLNAALAGYRTATASAEQAGTSDVRFAELRRAEDDARAALDHARAAANAVEAERQALSTLIDVAPAVASLDKHTAERAALVDSGPVPSPAAAQALRQARTDRETCAAALREAAHHLDGLRGQWAALVDDPQALALAAAFKDAEAGLEKHLATLQGLPGLQAEHDRRKAAWDAVAPGPDAPLPTTTQSAALQQCLERWTQREHDAVKAAGRVATAETALAQAEAARAAAPATVEGVEELDVAIAAARGAAKRLDPRLAEEAALAASEAAARTAAVDLGFTDGLDDLDAVAVPDTATRQQWVSRWQSAAKAADDARRGVDDARRALQAAEHSVAARALSRDVPDEATLRSRRVARDEALRAQLAGAGPGAVVVETLVRDADLAADERFAAADMLGRRAEAEAERARHAAALVAAEATRAEREASLAAVEAAWLDETRRRGLPALPLEGLQTSLTRVDQLRAAAQDGRQRRAQLAQEGAEAAAALEVLCGLLRRAPEAPSRVALDVVLRAADGERARRIEAGKQIGVLDAAVAHRKGEVDRARQEADAARVTQDDARQKWWALAEGIGAPSSPSTALARAWLDGIAQAVDAAGLLTRAKRAVDDAAAELAAFAQRAAPLATLLDDDVPPHERVLRLGPRMKDAHTAAIQRAQLTAQLRTAEQRHATCAQAADAAEQAWLQRRSAAGIAGDDEVDAALQRADEAARLAGLIDQASKVLATHDPDDLRARIAGRDDATLQAARAAAALRASEAEALVQERSIRLAEARTRRSAVDGRAGAADAAQTAAFHVAAARRALRELWRERAVDWMLTELQDSLSRAADGPVRRAGEIFRGLTAGSFAGVDVLNDVVEGRTVRHIVGRRDNGERIGVAGMSDGTRDALWLALRLAAIEAEIDAGRALPVVLDDVAVHLSDERTARVLAACDALAARTQVLLFTHHRAVVSQAQATLPGCEVVELRPRGADTPPVPRDAPPPGPRDDAPDADTPRPEAGRASRAAPRAAPRGASADDPTYRAIVEHIQKAGAAGVGKGALVDAGLCSDEGWTALRGRLDGDERIDKRGERKARVYVWRDASTAATTAIPASTTATTSATTSSTTTTSTTTTSQDEGG
jgi:uncharacterized protein YhaN